GRSGRETRDRALHVERRHPGGRPIGETGDGEPIVLEPVRDLSRADGGRGERVQPTRFVYADDDGTRLSHTRLRGIASLCLHGPRGAASSRYTSYTIAPGRGTSGDGERTAGQDPQNASWFKALSYLTLRTGRAYRWPARRLRGQRFGRDA